MKDTHKKGLTNLEVLASLKETPKVYDGVMPQTKFATYCSRIKVGRCKPSSVISFFAEFGYIGDWNNFIKVDIQQ